MKEIAGELTARGLKVAIVSSRFNELITRKLRAGALDYLKRNEINEQDITDIWVPGAFEIPFTAKKLAQQNQHDAIICLGAVIRGDTTHYDYVCNETAKGISYSNLNFDTPVIFGVLTTENLEQALERSGSKSGNKGWEAAMAAVEMANLNRKLVQEQ